MALTPSLERAGYVEAYKCMKERSQAATLTQEDQHDCADAMTGDGTLVGSTSGDVLLDGPTPASGSHAGKSPVKALSTLTQKAEDLPRNVDSDSTAKSLSLSPKKALSPIKEDFAAASASPEKQTTDSAAIDSAPVEADGEKGDGMDEDSIFGDTAESEERVEEVEDVAERPEEETKEEARDELPVVVTEEEDLGYLYTVSRMLKYAITTDMR
jgi:hypothetical protein